MKLVYITKIEENNYIMITEVKYRDFWGDYFVRVCMTPYDREYTFFMDNGKKIPTRLYKTFDAFKESKEKTIKF